MDNDKRTNAELADAATMADDPGEPVTQGVTYGVVNKTSSHMEVDSVPNDEPVNESPPSNDNADNKTASTPEQMDEQTTEQTTEQSGGDAEPNRDAENGEISLDKRRADSASSAVTIQKGKHCLSMLGQVHICA